MLNAIGILILLIREMNPIEFKFTQLKYVVELGMELEPSELALNLHSIPEPQITST